MIERDARSVGSVVEPRVVTGFQRPEPAPARHHTSAYGGHRIGLLQLGAGWLLLACNSLLGIESGELADSGGGGSAGERTQESAGSGGGPFASVGGGGSDGAHRGGASDSDATAGAPSSGGAENRAGGGASVGGSASGGTPAGGTSAAGGGGDAGQTGGFGGGAETGGSAAGGQAASAGEAGVTQSGDGGTAGSGGASLLAGGGGVETGGTSGGMAGGGGEAGSGVAGSGGDGALGGSTEQGGGGPCAGVDLATSQENCGWCGHDCLGNACSVGTCVSDLVAHDDWGDVGDVVAAETLLFWVGGMLSYQDIVNPQLVSGLIAIDQVSQSLETWDNQLFLVENGENASTAVVAWTSLDEPGPVLGRGIDTPWIQGFTVDDDGLYWGSCPEGEPNSLLYLSWTAGSDIPEVLATDIPCPSRVIADDPYLWFTSEQDGGVYRVAKTDRGLSAPPPVVDTGAYGNRALLLTFEYVYVGSWNRLDPNYAGDSIYRFLRRNPSPDSYEIIDADRWGPWEFAFSGGFLYWTEQGESEGSGSVSRVEVEPSLGLAQGLAFAQNKPLGLSIQGDWVYWVSYALTGGNDVRRVPK